LITSVLHIQKTIGLAGSERHLLQLLPALAKRGVRVRMCVLAAGSSHQLVAAMQEQGVEVSSIPSGPDLNPILFARLAREIRRQQPDLVHTHLIHADLHGQLAARALKVPAVSSVHGTHGFYEKEPFRSAARLAGHLAQRTIAISDYTGEFVERVAIVPGERIRVIHYGIDSENWDITPNERREHRLALGLRSDEIAIGIASRLVPDKGHDVAINAFSSLVQQIPTARLLIAGSGPQQLELEALARRIRPSDRVRFLGYVADMRGFFGACDLVLFPSLPSFGEGFGLAALEAMAAGVPVLASNAGPLPEVVSDGVSGLLLPPGEPAAWAEAMVDLATNPSRRHQLGEQARTDAQQRFSVEEMADRTVGVYQEVLGRKIDPGPRDGREVAGGSEVTPAE
jgi:glycosyltransferase involved in cell wall biosynthesis